MMFGTVSVAVTYGTRSATKDSVTLRYIRVRRQACLRPAQRRRRCGVVFPSPDKSHLLGDEPCCGIHRTLAVVVYLCDVAQLSLSLARAVYVQYTSWRKTSSTCLCTVCSSRPMPERKIMTLAA